MQKNLLGLFCLPLTTMLMTACGGHSGGSQGAYDSVSSGQFVSAADFEGRHGHLRYEGSCDGYEIVAAPGHDGTTWGVRRGDQVLIADPGGDGRSYVARGLNQKGDMVIRAHHDSSRRRGSVLTAQYVQGNGSSDSFDCDE